MPSPIYAVLGDSKIRLTPRYIKAVRELLFAEIEMRQKAGDHSFKYAHALIGDFETSCCLRIMGEEEPLLYEHDKTVEPGTVIISTVTEEVSVVKGVRKELSDIPLHELVYHSSLEDSFSLTS